MAHKGTRSRAARSPELEIGVMSRPQRAGSGRAIVEGDLIALQPWRALRVPAGSGRSFEAGDDGLEFLAFGTHTEGDQGEFVDAGWPS